MMILSFKYDDGTRVLFSPHPDKGVLLEEVHPNGMVRTAIPFDVDQATELRNYLDSQLPPRFCEDCDGADDHAESCVHA